MCAEHSFLFHCSAPFQEAEAKAKAEAEAAALATSAPTAQPVPPAAALASPDQTATALRNIFTGAGAAGVPGAAVPGAAVPGAVGVAVPEAKAEVKAPGRPGDGRLRTLP